MANTSFILMKFWYSRALSFQTLFVAPWYLHTTAVQAKLQLIEPVTTSHMLNPHE